MALIARPTLLLLDEPTAGINPTLINGVLARLKTVNQNSALPCWLLNTTCGLL